MKFSDSSTKLYSRNDTKLFDVNLTVAEAYLYNNGIDTKITYSIDYVNNEVSSEGRWKMKKTNLIKTPKERITLGECVRTETGEPALKVKKSNKDMYETISMSQLIELMVLMSNQN